MLDQQPDQFVDRASALKSDAKMTILSQFASINMIQTANETQYKQPTQ